MAQTENTPSKVQTKNLTNAGKGRPKGTPNKTTRMLKDALLIAAEQAGAQYGKVGMVSYLEHQAHENPQAFMSLLGKVLPIQLRAEIEGDVTHVVELKWKE